GDGTGDLAAHRPAATSEHLAIDIRVHLGERLAIATQVEATWRDSLLRPGWRAISTCRGGLPACQPLHHIAEPGAVVEARTHGLAVLPVVHDADAQLGLFLDHLRDGAVQAFAMGALVKWLSAL